MCNGSFAEVEIQNEYQAAIVEPPSMWTVSQWIAQEKSFFLVRQYGFF